MTVLATDRNRPARDAADIFQAALAKIRAGEHDDIGDLLNQVRCASGGDEITLGVLEAAQRLAETWSRLLETTRERERALVRGREHAAAIAEQLVRMIEMARAGIARAGIEAGQADAAEAGPRCARPTARVCVTVLGPFRVAVDGQPIEDWPNGKTKAIFKYLVLNRQRPVAKEALMELFWPDLEPEAARNNLNVAIHRLRRTLARNGNDPAFVLFDDGHYMLNPRLDVRTDADEFLQPLERARRHEAEQRTEAAMSELAAAVALYQTELLAEDRYEGWIDPLRQQLRDACLEALGKLCRFNLQRERYPMCTALCAKILAIDGCNEEAHRTLMRCYARMSQPHLATVQYQNCVRTLRRELGISPSPETIALYRAIARGERA
ncbi:MAG: winged helix-turn-helix domain-containing protein [Burkholderiaceae bacterium]|nr:winged helix-turn-helix domain-containing protein [Burkholderiaceae bacterium]